MKLLKDIIYMINYNSNGGSGFVNIHECSYNG